ncbi:hypothetical protein DVH24_029791 [Malus domestica]|uniref:Uncharacterized protein n=1 Tax=Malus domestica TaxID=3750 RepID=A0A498HW94_MALDO|nr:hypothetical protein DVH24_029791 [Malus domestica]
MQRSQWWYCMWDRYSVDLGTINARELEALKLKPNPHTNSNKMSLSLKSAGVGNASILPLLFLGCLNEGFVVSVYIGGYAQRRLHQFSKDSTY